MARRWCQASRGRHSVPGSDRAFESGCLRVQPEAGGKLHLRLNTATRPIVDKARESPPGEFTFGITAGRIFRSVSGRRDSSGAGRRAGWRFVAAVASRRDSSRRTPVLLVGSPDGKNRRRGPVAGGFPSVGDEFRATFRPVLKHGPRSLTCARVNGDLTKNHVRRNKSEPFTVRTMA
ncbi:hypothetical protein ACI65C_003017 [Semiaphis heraclei]